VIEVAAVLLPALVKLPDLPPPYEILDTEPCRTYRMKVVRWEIGKLIIHPRWIGAPPEKLIHVIRVYTTEVYKGTWPYYWEITPRRLVSQLYTMFRAGIPEGMVLEIHRDVAGPKAHFSVRWVPEEGE